MSATYKENIQYPVESTKNSTNAGQNTQHASIKGVKINCEVILPWK